MKNYYNVHSFMPNFVGDEVEKRKEILYNTSHH